MQTKSNIKNIVTIDLSGVFGGGTCYVDGRPSGLCLNEMCAYICCKGDGLPDGVVPKTRLSYSLDNDLTFRASQIIHCRNFQDKIPAAFPEDFRSRRKKPGYID